MVVARLPKYLVRASFRTISAIIVSSESKWGCDWSTESFSDLRSSHRELADFLPFVLIFGVATTVDAVHTSLPHVITSHLTMQKIASQSSIEILDKFFKAVVMSNEIPLKLGSNILQILFETFAFCDLSVKNVLTAYQVSQH